MILFYDVLGFLFFNNCLKIFLLLLFYVIVKDKVGRRMVLKLKYSMLWGFLENSYIFMEFRFVCYEG